jgi:hypothetical protein
VGKRGEFFVSGRVPLRTQPSMEKSRPIVVDKIRGHNGWARQFDEKQALTRHSPCNGAGSFALRPFWISRRRLATSSAHCTKATEPKKKSPFACSSVTGPSLSPTRAAPNIPNVRDTLTAFIRFTIRSIRLGASTD